MKNILFVFTFLFSVSSFGQSKVNYALIDKKMAAIPSNLTTSTDSIAKYINANFKTEDEKIRAAFYWTAANISYDVENMFEVEYGETQQQRIDKTLKEKKGICRDYADVFNNIVNAVGIKSVVVSGYTKQNEKVDGLSHAWCAAKVDNKWYLFDPTWGTGYINNKDKRYTRNTNKSFFKIDPEIMIYSHMPFDYLWQFMDYPLTNKEFIDGVVAEDKTKKKFDFVKEIARFESLSKREQYSESSQRIQKNGMKNQFISQAYVNAVNHLNYETNIENRNKFNEIVKQKNQADIQYKGYIQYYNKQFQPTIPDEEIKKMLEEPRDKLAKCLVAISDFEKTESASSNQVSIDNLKKSISQTLEKIELNLQFVNLYLSKPKTVRKTLFYTVSKTPKKNN